MKRFSCLLLLFVALGVISCHAQDFPTPFFHGLDTVTAPGAIPNFSPTISYNSLRVKDSTMMFYQYSWHEYVTKSAGAKGHVWIKNVGPGIFTIGPQDTLFIKGSGVTFTKTGTDTLLMTVAAGSGDITSVGDVTSGAAFDGTQGTILTFNNAGGDGTFQYDGSIFISSHPMTLQASDPADAEALRFDNNEGIAWEASPASTDLTLKVDATEILQSSANFNAPTLTEATVRVITTASNLGGQLSNYDSKSGGDLRFNTFSATDFDLSSNIITIDAAIARDSELHDAVTLAGVPDYITISGQVITRGEITLTTHTAGSYVASVATTAPLSGGAGGSEGAALTLSITANGIGPTQIDETANYTWTGKHDYTGAEILGASALRFEGATDDNIYTIFAFTDPTSSSKTITFPNASGTVAVSATSPITLSAAGAIGLTQNAGTDVTADLEEETHVTEHQDGGADELSVTGLSGLLADVQRVGVRKNSTGTVFTRQQINLIEGSGISILVADDAGTPETDVTISASGTGEANTASNLGGGLANYDSKSSVDLRFNSFASADFDLAANLLTIDDTKWAKDSELHAAVTLAGENYLSLSTQQITANAVNLSGTHVTGTLAAARFGALTGDVTNSAGSYATTIANDVVTFAKFQNISANSVIARAAGTSGDLSEVALSASQLLGRGSTGNVAAITLGSGLSMSGTTLSSSGATINVGELDDDPIVAANRISFDQTDGFAVSDLGGGEVEIDITTLPIGKGGTGLTSTPTNGQLLIGNGSGYALATLTEGNYIDVTNGAGSITIALDPAEVGSVTWLDNADRNWTFDIAASGTNPVISFSNNTINVSTGALQVGSTNVALSSETFVTVSNTSGLSNERALSASNYIDLTDAGANSILAIAVDPTEMGTITWGDNTGNVVWTFDNSGDNYTITSQSSTSSAGYFLIEKNSADNDLVVIQNLGAGTLGLYVEGPTSIIGSLEVQASGSQFLSTVDFLGSTQFWGGATIKDGSGDSPNLTLQPFGGLAWNLYATSSDNDFNIQTNSSSTENVDITNVGSGVANLTVDGSINAVVIEGANSKTLTESSATSFVRVDVSAGSFVGGTIFYTIHANDGSNYQARSGSINFSIVSESADTETAGIGTVSSESIAASAGTLTVAFTTDDSPTDGINFQANAVSSLSQTTLQIKYRVVISSGTATVTGL